MWPFSNLNQEHPTCHNRVAKLALHAESGPRMLRYDALKIWDPMAGSLKWAKNKNIQPRPEKQYTYKKECTVWSKCQIKFCSGEIIRGRCNIFILYTFVYWDTLFFPICQIGREFEFRTGLTLRVLKWLRRMWCLYDFICKWLDLQVFSTVNLGLCLLHLQCYMVSTGR